MPPLKRKLMLMYQGGSNKRPMYASAMAAAAPYVRNRAPRRVKGAIKVTQELKYVDTTLDNKAFNTTGSVSILNLLAVGDDNTQRDGRQVCIKSVQILGQSIPEDASKANNLARCMLVWDNAINGTIAGVGDILDSVTANSFPKINNANRFTILWDWKRASGAIDTTATQTYSISPGTFLVEKYLKMNNIAQYSDTSALAASMQNGALYFVTVGTQAVGSADLFYGKARVRFTDN